MAHTPSSGSLLALHLQTSPERRLTPDHGRKRPAERRSTQDLPQRFVGAEAVLWMRDITELTGVHRSTIIRWIKKGTFPPRDAPHTSPVGWLRSTYDQWATGSSNARDGSGVRRQALREQGDRTAS
jgi:predicted DNA-binding transcriptional regulator AlpA